MTDARPAGQEPLLSPRARQAWRLVQILLLLLGVALCVTLFVAPGLGLDALWNVLIPVAPALLVVAPGLWRNICPLGTVALLPHHLGMSRQRRLSRDLQGWLLLAGVLLLVLMVPLRRVILNTSGPATALALLGLGAVALSMGLFARRKSGWCSGLCPVHAVERLYGSEPLLAPPNAHCEPCARCVDLCPDSTPRMHPFLDNGRSVPSHLASIFIVGAFPGFVWAWFHVADGAFARSWSEVALAYGQPLLAGLVTLAVFLALQRSLRAEHRDVLARAFATATVGCYYWYRLPALVGFGLIPGDGQLVDLSGTLPDFFPALSRAATTAFFAWWLLLRRGRSPLAWTVRPAFAVED